MVSCFPIEEQFIEAAINEGEIYDLPDGTSVSQPGTYTVIIEDEEGCPLGIFIVTLDVVSSISDLPLQNAISISPNPNSGSFILSLDFDGKVDFNASILDPLGKVVKQIDIQNKNISISENNLPFGVYFIRIEDKNGNLMGIKKFVVHE